MSKLVNVTKKGALWSVLLAVLLVAGLVVGIMFGCNQAVENKDAATLTVTVDSWTFNNDLDEVQDVCEAEFSANGLKYNYSVVAEMLGNDQEIVYVFTAGTDLETVKGTLETKFATWEGAWITVSSQNEAVKVTMPEGYIWRAAIAVVVMAVLAFAYTAIRYRWDMGVIAAIAIVLGACIPASILVLARIPVTNAAMYVVMFGALMAAVMTLLTMNNVSKKEFKADVDTHEELADCVALKDIFVLMAVLVIAFVAVGVAGIIANVSLLWFAISALIAVLTSAWIGLVYVPVYFLPLKNAADKREADKSSGYKGAQKTAAAVKKLFAKKEKESEESEE